MLTGDTVLGRGTTVIAHPDGALGPYLESLRRLADLAPGTAVLTGHGPELPDVAAVAAAYLAHREERLDQVRAALAAARPAGERRAQVVEVVYADVDRALWPAAELSVRAQLEYLRGVAATPGRTQSRPATTAPATPPTRNAACGPNASTTTPAADCPDDSPSVAAVTTQPNASVAVPAGRGRLDAEGVRGDLGGDRRARQQHRDDQRGQRARHRHRPDAQRERQQQHRQPQVQRARPGPQRVGDARQHRRDRPRRQQHAAQRGRARRGRHRGHADLDGADDQPEPQRREHDVRSPGTASAPNRPGGLDAAPGAASRTAWVSANADRAHHHRRRSATAVPVPGHGRSTSNAASDGPRMKNTSRLIAS